MFVGRITGSDCQLCGSIFISTFAALLSVPAIVTVTGDSSVPVSVRTFDLESKTTSPAVAETPPGNVNSQFVHFSVVAPPAALVVVTLSQIINAVSSALAGVRE